MLKVLLHNATWFHNKLIGDVVDEKQEWKEDNESFEKLNPI